MLWHWLILVLVSGAAGRVHLVQVDELPALLKGNLWEHVNDGDIINVYPMRTVTRSGGVAWPPEPNDGATQDCNMLDDTGQVVLSQIQSALQYDTMVVDKRVVIQVRGAVLRRLGAADVSHRARARATQPSSTWPTWRIHRAHG